MDRRPRDHGLPVADNNVAARWRPSLSMSTAQVCLGLGAGRRAPLRSEGGEVHPSSSRRPSSAPTHVQHLRRGGRPQRNGWWAQMGWDTIGKADVATGTTVEIKLPEIKSEMDKLSPAQLAAYEKVTDLSQRQPAAVGQGPRRMGTTRMPMCSGRATRGVELRPHRHQDQRRTMVPSATRRCRPTHPRDNKHNVWATCGPTIRS